jgi:hypothetical protein
MTEIPKDIDGKAALAELVAITGGWPGCWTTNITAEKISAIAAYVEDSEGLIIEMRKLLVEAAFALRQATNDLRAELTRKAHAS